jgi:hypothetical protein
MVFLYVTVFATLQASGGIVIEVTSGELRNQHQQKLWQ